MELPLELLDVLDKTPAADVKQKGWPSLMRKVRASGAVVVTNHNHPEAVVVEAGRYRELVERANTSADSVVRAQSLRSLQVKFDEHLATLKSGVLAVAIEKPARNVRKVKLGAPR